MKISKSVVFLVILLSISACELEGAGSQGMVNRGNNSVGILGQSPTDAPFVRRWTTQQVIDVFVAHGLEVGSYYLTTDDYWAAPQAPPAVPNQMMRFFIPTLCDTCGGRILSFENPDDLLLTKYYYIEIGRANAFLFSWVLEKDNILVQLNGFVEKESVRKYEAALNSLGG